VLATNPGLVNRFLKASYRGFADMLKDPAAAADVTVRRYPTLNREDTLQQAREQAELFVAASPSAGQRPGVMDRTKMERTREFLAEVYQKADVRVDDLYTNDFLPTQ
jgi:NitT/TauT family transport system substrate-binding protein